MARNGADGVETYSEASIAGNNKVITKIHHKFTIN